LVKCSQNLETSISSYKLKFLSNTQKYAMHISLVVMCIGRAKLGKLIDIYFKRRCSKKFEKKKRKEEKIPISWYRNHDNRDNRSPGSPSLDLVYTLYFIEIDQLRRKKRNKEIAGHNGNIGKSLLTINEP